jgi:hypothetical protein
VAISGGLSEMEILHHQLDSQVEMLQHQSYSSNKQKKASNLWSIMPAIIVEERGSLSISSSSSAFLG